MCFYVGNDVYHLRILPIWRTYKSYLRLHRSTAITAETFNKIISDLAIENWCQSDYEGWKRVGVARRNNEVTWKFDITS
jgi:hypothetical protein